MICTPQIERLVGNVGRMDERICTCRVLVGKPKRMRPFGRLRRGWEGNIKMALPKIGLEIVDRIDLTQYSDRWRAVVNKVMNILVP
jgi:hypothetical protein